MFVYWLIFLFPAWLAVTRLRPVQSQAARWSGSWHAVFWLLVLAIGLRYEVGGDWVNYLDAIKMVANVPLQQALSQGDPAYSLLNWLAVETGLGIYFTNTVCAALFAWGLLVFCRAQPRPWLALVVAVPYMVTVVAMGYTRQGIAIGLAMLGLVALADRKTLRFVMFVALAATFHKSAVILMPLAILAGTKRKIWTAFWVGLSSVLFFVLLLQDSVDALKSGYIEAEYQSQGAGLRLAMNAVPAILFLLFRRKFVMPQTERTFWTWMSLGALGFVVLLVVSPSSTAVDRLALYWIPLQLFVLSRLPNAIGKPNGLNSMLVNGVVAYSAVVLFVWLFFATHAEYWLPYQFYPWVWLFK
ncbi:MAG: EpsG family protein [Gallionella sp.]|nr:EpsG family protein [Gallionella sp.]